jgi:hypothetical protein
MIGPRWWGLLFAAKVGAVALRGSPAEEAGERLRMTGQSMSVSQ